MAQKFFRDLNGFITELEALVTSAGAGDAGKIIATDSTGRIDVSLLPVGVGAEVTVAATSENLTAGDFVNIHDSSGAKVRKADASTSAKPAVGFVLANTTSPASATVYAISNKNTALTSLTIGAPYFLATTPGTVTTTAPSAASNIVQLLGWAESATAIVFQNVSFFVKA